MSTIPNLLASRGRGRGRGRGPGGPGGPVSGFSPAGGPSTPPLPRKERVIRDTDSDAAVSRLSAVSAGYLEDEFARYFGDGRDTRRLPIINRGTYTRTTAIDSLVESFLSGSDTKGGDQFKQIISLGAGTDTRYFRLRKKNKHHHLLYHEFDFPDICVIKRQKVDGIISRLFDEELSGYSIHPLDLRTLPPVESLETFKGVRSDVPTLIISECCLCYLEVDTAREVIQWFTKRIQPLGIILYEPIRVNDPFGQTMVENLAARGIVMPTLQKYKTLEDQKTRLVELGFAGAESIDTNEIWEKWISEDEKERVNALEGLDEVEEWKLLASHYAVVWGWTSPSIFMKS
ncbi:S-adenosyl-L-methionine-dependent methyltransferase [Bisporella sp. PMI_857]|nr:S-adenosyl-L-methionine-dependent methyltransferase [Bisporella sp. PMI_857]